MGTEGDSVHISRTREGPRSLVLGAIKAITCENPVSAEAVGDMEAMTNAWLDWARRNDYR